MTANNHIAGIPADSEYVVFIIDTSGSMAEVRGKMVDVMGKFLDSYPQVKGIQILNGRGHHLHEDLRIPGVRRGQWMEDSPQRRAALMRGIKNWNREDWSNPQKGIISAIDLYHRPGRNMSIYVFGDDFQNGSAAQVVEAVTRKAPSLSAGRHPVRIHGVGLTSRQAGERGMTSFANLMRVLSSRTGGAFVGLRGH